MRSPVFWTIVIVVGVLLAIGSRQQSPGQHVLVARIQPRLHQRDAAGKRAGHRRKIELQHVASRIRRARHGAR